MESPSISAAPAMEQGRSNRQLFLDTLHELGVGEQSARGALGSLAWESGHDLKNNSRNAGDGADGSDSIGWAQWNQDRATALKPTGAAMGLPWDDPRVQAQHIKNELTGRYKNVLNALRERDDMLHGADVWTRLYENPAVKNVEQRYNRAVQIANMDGAYAPAPRSYAGVPGSGVSQDNKLDIRPYSEHTAYDIWTPPIDATPEEKLRKREEDAARIAAQPFSQTLQDAYSTGSLTGAIMRAGSLQGFEPDSNYSVSQEELQQRTANLAPVYHDWFEKAVSAEHADAIQSAAEQHQASMLRLQEQGWTGLAAEGMAMFLDPTAIALGAGAGALSTVAARTAALSGRVSHAALEMGLGAGLNVGTEKTLEAVGDPEHHDLITSALVGAALGGTVGLLSGARGADRVSAAARKDLRKALGDAPERPIVEDPHGPTPERPEPVRPDPTAPKRTGDWTLDDAMKRNAEWDAIDRADELFRRRLEGRQEKGGSRDMGTEPDAPRNPPNDTTHPTPHEPLGPNEVETNVLNESSLSRKTALVVEDLAARAGVAALIRVGDIRNWSARPANAKGVVIPLSDGSYRLLIDHRLPVELQAETIAHEFGHVVDFVTGGIEKVGGRARSGTVTKNAALRDAHAQWEARAKTKTPKQFFDGYYAPAQRQHMTPVGSEAFDKPLRELDGNWFHYATSSAEWWAQEWAKAMAHGPEHHGAFTKFHKGMGAFWRRMYYVATGHKPENVPTKAFQEWLKGNYDENAIPAKRLGAAASEALASAELPTQVGPAIVNPGRPTLAAGGGLGSVSDDAVARTALGGLRFSIAAVAGKSNNPAVRAFGSLLVEDNVGKQGGAVNPHSAELYARQRTNASLVAVGQARKPAWDAWRKENGLGYFEAKRREGEFESTVAEAMRLPNNSPEFGQMPKWAQTYSQHLNQIADEVRQHLNNPFLLEGLEGRPVDSFGTVEGDERYLTRVWSPKKISELVATEGGYQKMERLIVGAIMDAQPELDIGVAEKIGLGFAREIYKRARGVIDEKTARMFAVDNLESVKSDLIDRYGLSVVDAEAVVGKLRKGSDAHADPRAKRRVLMNEQYEEGGLKLSDLLVNNATALTTAYAKHGWGKVALARLRVRDDDGNVRLDGVTNEGDWNAALKAIREKGHDMGIPHPQTEWEIQALQVAYERILGVPTPHHDEGWAKKLRVLNKLNLLRLGHQFTFAQAGEFYNMLANLSVSAMAKQVPSFRRVLTADARWVKANGLDRWVETVFGLGADGIRLIADTTHADDLHSLPMEAVGFWDNAEKALSNAGNSVLHLSGFHFVDGLMKQWTAKTIAQEIFEMAGRFKELPDGSFDTSRINFRRMAQLGLDDGMLQRVARNMKDNVTAEKGALTGAKLTNPNLDKWADQEARIAFEGALMRKARQIIQENDIGSMHQWMPHPVWQMITQFRAFPLHAYDKQLMLNLAMHDTQSLNALVLGAIIPTLIYAVQQHLNALGRSDSGEWLDKRLDAQHLLSASIQRHGWSSLVPTVVDTALPFVGQKPVFDTRNTGQQADLIFGNPTMSLLQDTSRAVGGLVGSLRDGRRLSQDEVRDWHRLFGNNLVSGAVLNSIIGGRPVHPPKSFNYH